MKPKAEEFYDYLAEPVKYCAKFYGFMYLSDIKNIPEVGFDLLQLTNELKQAFHHYGKFSIMKEMVNVPRYCGFDPDIVKSLVSYDVYNDLTVDIQAPDGVGYRPDYIKSNDVYREVPMDISEQTMRKIETRQFDYDIDRTLRNLVQNAATGPERLTADIDEISPGSIRQETKMLLQSRIDKYVNIVPQIESNNFFYMCERLFEDMEWGNKYGGEGWASIAKALQLIHTTTDKTFVDSMWGLQHNTGTWLNNINKFLPDEEYYDKSTSQMGDIDIVDSELMEEMNKEYTQEEVMLQIFLEAKREGEFYKVYPLITNADPKLAKYEDIFKNAGR